MIIIVVLIYAKYEVNENIDYSVYWYVDRIFGSKVVRVNNGGLESVSVDGERVTLKASD